MSIITCTKCRQKFDGDEYGDSVDFDMHECPSEPEVKENEMKECKCERCTTGTGTRNGKCWRGATDKEWNDLGFVSPSQATFREGKVLIPKSKKGKRK